MKRVVLARPLRKESSYVKKTSKPGNNPPPPPIPFRGGEGRGVLPQTAAVSEEKKDNVTNLLAMADQLTETERKQLLAKLALGAQLTQAGETRDVDMWAGAVYEGLVAAFGGEVGAGVGPLAVKRTMAAPAIWGPVSSFMASSRLDKLKVTERQSVYVLLAKLAIEKARYVASRGGAPLSAKLVGTVATNMAGIFDQAFPGYLASGLAPLVAKQLIAAKEPA